MTARTPYSLSEYPSLVVPATITWVLASILVYGYISIAYESNAQGYVIDTQYCDSAEIIIITYETYKSPGIWHVRKILTPNLCAFDCCLPYQIYNTTLYFVVKGNEVAMYTAPYYRPYYILIFSIIMYIAVAVYGFKAWADIAKNRAADVELQPIAQQNI